MHASPRRRGPLAASILALLTTAGLAAPAVGQAATYDVQECHQSSGFAVSGVVGTASGNLAFVNSGCGSGARNLGGSFGSSVEHANGDIGEVSFAAPAGTSLDSLSAHRDAAAGVARVNGAPLARLYSTPGGARETYAAVAGYAASGLGSLFVNLDGDSSVSWGVVCAGAAGCPAGDSRYLLSDLTIRLRDANVPSLSNVSGSLLSSTNRARTRSLTYNASDSGGGVYRQRLIVDGASRPAEIVDSNSGACATPFTRPVPCKTQVSGTVNFDTSTLADGEHSLSLDVRDATDDNKALYGPWSIMVDNTPPGIGALTITGTAREGDTLTCAAPVGGQPPLTVTYQWLRAEVDGSGAAPITGATNAAYTLVNADVSKKLVCRVTATDAGGSTVRDSTITQSPFDSGRTVSRYCTDRPTGPGDECGDLDGDRIPNREDEDIDGDGVLNVSDVAPYDPARPGPDSPAATPTPTPTPTPTTSTPPTAANDSAPAAATSQPTAGPAGQTSQLGAAGTVKFLLGRETATFIGKRSRWVKSAFTLRGRLTAATGEPIGGLKLFVSQTVGSRTVALGSTLSSSDGAWSFKVPRGPGRTITVAAGDGVNAATMTVRQQVLAHVTFRALRKRVPSGGLARFTGQLRGGHTNTREKLVEFQVYYRRSWRTIGTLRVNRNGKFSVRYRFGSGAFGRYKFRARTMPTDGYPFAVGRSSTTRSSVRVG